MEEEKRKLLRVLYNWRKQILKALSEVEKADPNRVYISVKPKDLFLLLNWRVWCKQYQIPLTFVISTLLEYFHRVRRSTKSRRSRWVSLGVKISTLTGPAAEEVIAIAVQRDFPARENEASARTDLRKRLILPSGRLRFPTSNPDRYIRAYLKQVSRHRQSEERTSSKFKRPWRGNPFI